MKEIKVVEQNEYLLLHQELLEENPFSFYRFHDLIFFYYHVLNLLNLVKHLIDYF